MNNPNDKPGRNVSFYDNTGLVESLITQRTRKTNESKSEVITMILIENVDEYVDLSEKEQELVNQRKLQREERISTELAKYQRQTNTFEYFVASMLKDQFMKGADVAEAREWLERMEDVFELRGHEDIYEEIYDNPEEWVTNMKKEIAALRRPNK